MELFKEAQLRSMQASGTQVVTDSELLGSKYSDRWEIADRLMNQVNEEFHHKFNSFDPTNPLHKEKWEDENIEICIDLFERAIAIDPNFADAYAETLYFDVDKRWRGELPLTFLFDSINQKTKRIGLLPETILAAWLTKHKSN